jgi:hypothetical protein
MSFDNAATERMCGKYKDLISSFVRRQILAEHWKSAYLSLFAHDNDQVRGSEFSILDKSLFAVDD